MANQYTVQGIKKRFLDIYKSSYIDANGCRLWSSRTDDHGYGILCYRRKEAYRKLRAPRLAYEHFKGDIPEGLMIRHLCHNKICVNPDHLEVGTNQDNANDQVAASKQLRGETHPRAKLTENMVRQIRLLVERGLSNKEIAAKFSVTDKTVCHIKSGRLWRHVS